MDFLIESTKILDLFRPFSTLFVTLVWGGRHVDVKTAEWDERSVLIRTEDAGLGSGKIYDYSGVKLSDLMILAGESWFENEPFD